MNKATHNTRKSRNKKSGSALLTTFMVLMIIAIAGASYVAASMTTIQLSSRQAYDIQTGIWRKAALRALC